MTATKGESCYDAGVGAGRVQPNKAERKATPPLARPYPAIQQHTLVQRLRKKKDVTTQARSSPLALPSSCPVTYSAATARMPTALHAWRQAEAVGDV